jgi:hypothetical protein
MEGRRVEREGGDELFEEGSNRGVHRGGVGGEVKWE